MFSPDFKVYIIGNFFKSYKVDVKKQYSTAQQRLERLGFDVINPVEHFFRNEYSHDIIPHLNLSHLLEANAVYVLADVKIDAKHNIEIKTALKLGLYFFHESNIEISLSPSN